ncbi:MAG: hypothetical protein OHK0022_39530 [Roseiflexaceae bacterium]
MSYRRILWMAPALLLIASLLSVASPTGTAQAQTAERCFPETGFCISGRIREFWEQNGGLPVFGFPIGPQQQETIEGKSLQVQRFERNRLELHPENARPYDVLLGRLGADRLVQQGRDWNTAFPKEGSQGGCRFFPETGHNVCGAILNAWRAQGLELDGRRGKTEAENLALFGLPLSGLVTETLSDGKQYQVQWFERARFEIHPENQPPYNVLLGLLGREVGGSGSQPPSNPPAQTPLPPAQNAAARPERGPAGTRFVFTARGFRPGENIGVYFTAPDKSVYGAPFQTQADDQGVSDGVFLNTNPSFPTGIWAITFEGTESGNKGIAYFEVTGSAPQPTPPPQAGGGGQIPPSQNAVVRPESGPRGTTFAAIGRGFRPGERIGVYVTAPDRSVYGAPFQVGADDAGLSDVVTFNTANDPSFPTGIWAITFEGVDSGNKAIAYFQVTP